MFGYILIKKNRYNEKIKEYEDIISDLQVELRREQENHKIANKEIIRLTSEISAQVKNCNIGVWCNNCAHRAYASTGKLKRDSVLNNSAYYYVDGENIQYCKKHLHELCPEWEQENITYYG